MINSFTRRPFEVGDLTFKNPIFKEALTLLVSFSNQLVGVSVHYVVAMDALMGKMVTYMCYF